MSSEYQDLFNFSLDILCINGLDGYFKLVNPAFERILGYPWATIKTMHFLEFIHPDDQAATRAEMKNRVDGHHTTHFQNRYRRADGTYVWIEWTSFPVQEKGVMYAVGHDITERRKADDIRLQLEREKAARIAAERAIELRNEFIAIASHELRTPLTSLKLHTQLFGKMICEGTLGNLPIETQKKMVDLAEHQVDRLANLTNDMLSVSKITTGLLVLDLRTVDLSQLVQKVLEDQKLALEKAGCRLEMQLAPNLVGRWDRSRIEQIVENLLSNAVKFGQGQPIRVVTEMKGGTARLSVKDHGIGISPEDRARIFERFERAVPIKAYEGLGLGLYIATQFATAHGGKISVESEKGKGATFIVDLPLGRTV